MCFEKRKTPVAILCGCSVVAVIFGILMIVFSILLTSNKLLTEMEETYSELSDARKLMFVGLLIFALITIGIAACGFFCKCVKNRCFTCLYGIILLPTWIVTIIIGASALALSAGSKQWLEDECVKINSVSQEVEISEGYTVSVSLDIYESLFVNDYMCSEYCPCAPTNAASQWEG